MVTMLHHRPLYGSVVIWDDADSWLRFVRRNGDAIEVDGETETQGSTLSVPPCPSE